MSERPDEETRRRLRVQHKQAERDEWEAQLPLDLDDMSALLDHLDAELGDRGCDHTLRITEAWLGAHDHDVANVVAALRNMGGHCDCEVLANVDPDDHI